MALVGLVLGVSAISEVSGTTRSYYFARQRAGALVKCAAPLARVGLSRDSRNKIVTKSLPNGELAVRFFSALNRVRNLCLRIRREFAHAQGQNPQCRDT